MEGRSGFSGVSGSPPSPPRRACMGGRWLLGPGLALVPGGPREPSLAQVAPAEAEVTQVIKPLEPKHQATRPHP